MLRGLDVVGLSVLTSPCSVTWRSGTVPVEWRTGVMVAIYKEGLVGVLKFLGYYTGQPPNKVYSRVLERKFRPFLNL